MLAILKYLALGFLFGLVILYCKYRLRIARNESKATTLGCKPIPSISHKLLFGLDTTRSKFIATKEDRLLPYFQNICSEIGALTYRYQWLDKVVIFTAEPANLRALVATNFKDFELPTERNEALRPLFGEAIFIQNGEAWRHSRSLLRPYFSREHIATLQAAEQQIKLLVDRLPGSSGGWTEATDLHPLFADFAMNNASDFLFGRPTISSPSSGKPENEVETKRVKTFVEAMDFMSEYAGLRLFAGTSYWVFNSKRFQTACQTIYDYVDTEIAKSLSSKSTNSDKFTLVDALAKDVPDPQALRPFILTTLFAGRDTTASTLGFLFFSLSHSPERYSKLRAIILEEFGTFESPRDITLNSLRACSYLQDCINESLRLYPPLSLNARTAVRDTVLPSGGGIDGTAPVFVSKGTKVQFSSFVTHRLKQIWGDDAEEWKPERWTEKTTGVDTGYMPFNGGPRICIGQQQALTNISFLAVRMLQRFDAIEACSSDPRDLKYDFGVILRKFTEGIRVRFHVAAES